MARQQSSFSGEIPTYNDWVTNGVSYIGEYANTGKKLSDIESTQRHYNNFVKTLGNLKTSGNTGHFNETLSAHGFAKQGGGSGGGSGGGGGGGGGGSRKSSGGSGGGGGGAAATNNDLVNKLFAKIDEMMGAKASKSLEKDPYGIAETKLNHLGEEQVRRSFLSNGGEEGGYSSNMVVDPATGKAFQSAEDAKAAGITNWVYKFQYDRKSQDSPLSLTDGMASTSGNARFDPNNPYNGGQSASLSDTPTDSLGQPLKSNIPLPSASSTAKQGYKWRNRNTTNQWYAYS